MALDKAVVSFINNPYSLDNILKLNVHLTGINRGSLYLEVEDFLASVDNEYLIRSYSNLLSLSAGLTISSANHYLAMVNNDNKKIIINQISLIEKYLLKHIKLIPELYLYPFYQGLVKRSMNFFTDAVATYPDMLDDHLLTLEMRLYIDYLANLNRSSISLFKSLCMHNINNRFDSEIKKLYEHMPRATQNKLITMVPASILDDVDLDYIIDNLAKFNRYDEIYKQLKRAMDSLTEANRINIFMRLAYSAMEGRIVKFNDYLYKLRSELPDCRLLDLYLANLFNNHSFYYRALSNDDTIELENYFLYFEIKAIATFNEDIYQEPVLNEIYTLNDICGNELIRFVIRDGESSRYDYTNLIDGYSSTTALNSVLEYANHNLYGFIEARNEAEAKRNEYEERLADEELLDAFKEIEDSSLSLLSGSLSDNMRVAVEYSFYHIDRDDFSLSLRIGNMKTYSVASPAKFLAAFDDEERIKYGKDLTLTHKIDNLNERDREPIGFLRSLSPRASKKYLDIDGSSTLHLFNLLKNRVIGFEDVPYVLRLNDAEARFKLDRDYTIDFKMDYDEVIPCFNSYLALDKNNHYIDLISSKDKGLIEFVIKYRGLSLKRVKKDFGERIYPIYSNLIELDEEIKNEFKASEMEINAYFDFDGGGRISSRSSYNKDGRLLLEENIANNSDRIKLRRYKDALASLGFNEYDVILDESDIISFLKADLKPLKKLANVYLSDSILNKQLMVFTPPTLKMSFKNDMLNVFMKDSRYSDEELYKILDALKRKKKYVLLEGDRIIDLDNNESNEFLDMVNDLSLDSKHLSEEDEKPLYQTLIAFKHLDHIELDSYLMRLVDDIKGFKNKKLELPGLNATLRDYQIEGFNWLKILSGYHLGGILADDMGLGKTLEIITLLASDSEKMPSLIVTPKSLIFNWISEFNRFAPDYEIIPIYGMSSLRADLINKMDSNKRIAYITSYDSLRMDVKKYKHKFNYLILDEAQYIKNALALTTKAVKEIESNNRFALTGTPIENDIFDLWSIFDFLMPSYLPAVAKFKANANNEAFQEMVKKRVAPFILRRTKEAVLTELPEKFERVISADMTENQRKLYDAHSLNAREILNSGGRSFDVLHLLTRLRQICVDPRTFVDNIEEKSGKMLLLREMLPEYIKDGHRILIFSQFVKALNLVEEELKDLGIKYLLLTGDTDSRDRVKYVYDFNHDEDYKVFLISLKAGGNGLNLVGADTVIHLDPWWNLASENQATDRAYRMGQTRNVEVIRLIVADSIEQRVVELQYKKKDLIDKLISNDTKAIERISLDDMKFILE